MPELKLDVQNDTSITEKQKFLQLADINKANEYLSGMQQALIELADKIHGLQIEMQVIGGDGNE